MSKTKKLLAAVLLVVLAAGALLAWLTLRPEAVAGAKTIEVLVIHGDKSEKTFTIHTDAETLRAALDQESLVAGEEGEFGLYILTVDGETADEAQRQWWCLSKNGEMLMAGAEETVIADGEHYELILSVW